MIPSVPCMVCGGHHRVSKCSALNPPPPEGIPNPDGGGQRAGQHEHEDSLKHKIASEQEHSQGDEGQPIPLEVAL
jgi:hypothetical protein